MEAQIELSSTFLFPDCRFQCHCHSLGGLQLQCHSQKPLPPLETYSAHSTSSAMFVTGIMPLFRSNCQRGVQKRISLDAAILCSKLEARISDTAGKR